MAPIDPSWRNMLNEGFREAALAHRNLRGERDDPDPLSARLSAVLAAPKGRAPDFLKAYSESVRPTAPARPGPRSPNLTIARSRHGMTFAILVRSPLGAAAMRIEFRRAPEIARTRTQN